MTVSRITLSRCRDRERVDVPSAVSGEGMKKGGDTFPVTAFSMQWTEGKHLLPTPEPYLEHSLSSELPRLGQAAV